MRPHGLANFPPRRGRRSRPVKQIRYANPERTGSARDDAFVNVQGSSVLIGGALGAMGEALENIVKLVERFVVNFQGAPLAARFDGNL